MSRVTSSHFAKYFCDMYSEYITPCVVMIDVTSDAIQVMPLRLHTLRSRLRSSPTEWIIQQMTRKRKPSNLFIVFRAMNEFSYHILPIIHSYNIGISRLRSEDVTSVGRSDFGRMRDSNRKTRLRSYARLRSEDVTPVGRSDFGRMRDSNRKTRLRSYA
jgi:hypothetical protein